MTTPAATIGPDPFQLLTPRGAISRLADASLGRLLGLRTLADLYTESRSAGEDSFAARALQVLDTQVSVTQSLVPGSGPLIVAANHPTGLADGLALVEALRPIRQDVRIVVNHLLARVPELRDLCFFVDPFGGPNAAARSRAGLRAAHLWLRGGGALIVFPAGMVAPRLDGDGTPHEAAWQVTVGRLALATRASVVPASIDARNSDTFYRLGRLHPRLRTALLPRQLLRQRGRTIHISLGPTLQPAALTTDNPAAVTDTIRQAVDSLSRQRPPASRQWSIPGPVDPSALFEDVLSLEPLTSAAEFDVYCAEAAAIPHVLREIGRLREITFRAAGEGTGQPSDLDRFDDHYLHLFAWNRITREVVGAYRVGRTDEILARHGVHGLYTRTLFRYDERLLGRLSPALELGRAFVRPEYQRNPSTLLVLWKGIGRLVAREPRYRRLFGPVSISSRYADTSVQLLLGFLQQNHRDAELAALVQALDPPSHLPQNGAAVRTAGDVDALIARAEPDGKGMPVLLRQYLRLNARVLGFNVDRTFGDALDALVAVDLLEVEPAILARYLGKQAAAGFVAVHRPRAA